MRPATPSLIKIRYQVRGSEEVQKIGDNQPRLLVRNIPRSSDLVLEFWGHVVLSIACVALGFEHTYYPVRSYPYARIEPVVDF